MVFAAGQRIKARFDSLVELVADLWQKRPDPQGHASPSGIIIREVRKHLPASAFIVQRAEYDTTQPVKQHCSRTHHAGLKRRVAGHLTRSRPQIFRDTPQSFNLSVAARVVMRNKDSVPGFCNHTVFQSDDRCDGKIALLLGCERQIDRATQVKDVTIYRFVNRCDQAVTFFLWQITASGRF